MTPGFSTRCSKDERERDPWIGDREADRFHATDGDFLGGGRVMSELMIHPIDLRG